MNTWLVQYGDTITSIIGIDTEILGALSHTGQIHDYTPQASPGEELKPDQNHQITHIAIAGNEQVAAICTTKSDPRPTLVTSPDYAAFRAWLVHDPNTPPDPSAAGDTRTIPFPDPITQLVANEVSFTILTGSKVYTLGDARYPCALARVPCTSDPTPNGAGTPAGEPGLVAALDGVRITKIVSCGFMSGAVSADGAVYLWGCPTPGSDALDDAGDEGRVGGGLASVLRSEDGEDVALVRVFVGTSVGGLTGKGNLDVETGKSIQQWQELDVDFVDLAMGTDHVLVLAEDGRVFGIGSNEYGQLGLGTASQGPEPCRIAKGAKSWTQIASSATGVFAGPSSSFIARRR